MRENPTNILPFPTRLLEGVVAAGLISAMYFAAGHRVSMPQAAWEHVFDAKIPFIPETVWIYMPGYWSIFLLATITVRESVRWRAAVLALIAVTLAAVPFFLLWPVAGPRPEAPADPTWTGAMVRWLYANDPSVNTFPSLHIANSTLCALLVAANDRRWRLPALGMAVAVAVSVLTLKQHWLVDVPAGCLLGALGFLAWRGLVALPERFAIPERPFQALAPERVIERLRVRR